MHKTHPLLLWELWLPPRRRLLQRQTPRELRKQSQNPIANLISVPVQENWNFDIGQADRTQNVVNIQPVIPFSVSKDWNLITRWITPIIYQPLPVAQPPGLPEPTGGGLRIGRH